ncbi:unnamed protein product, partial [Prorocentrum cordatum]
ALFVAELAEAEAKVAEKNKQLEALRRPNVTLERFAGNGWNKTAAAPSPVSRPTEDAGGATLLGIRGEGEGEGGNVEGKTNKRKMGKDTKDESNTDAGETARGQEKTEVEGQKDEVEVDVEHAAEEGLLSALQTQIAAIASE